MIQRREQTAAPGGSTVLASSGSLGAVSRGIKDSTLARPSMPHSRNAEAAGGHTAEAQSGELSTQCAKNTVVSITMAWWFVSIVECIHRQTTYSYHVVLILNKLSNGRTSLHYMFCPLGTWRKGKGGTTESSKFATRLPGSKERQSSSFENKA